MNVVLDEKKGREGRLAVSLLSAHQDVKDDIRTTRQLSSATIMYSRKEQQRPQRRATPHVSSHGARKETLYHARTNLQSLVSIADMQE